MRFTDPDAAKLPRAKAVETLQGEKLVVDPQLESFTSSLEGNALLEREYRSPHLLPEHV